MSKTKQKKYDHVFAVNFSLQSNNDGDHVTRNELLTALEKRFHHLLANDDEIIEACGLPLETVCTECVGSMH